MLKKILIANRGEIACRIIDSCRRLGVRTIAVHSSADDQARHVKMADERVAIGNPPASESYLCIDKLINAAKLTNAEGIHPGYGFLAENAALASACEKAGLAFIGPTAETITAMGSKRVAKDIMQAAGVPVVPGFQGSQDDADLAAGAIKTGFPVLIKASAGGGGKGMRVVHIEAEFKEALAAARREARSSFGDDEVIIEKYIQNPRHIEVQIFGDSHDNLVHLFERECSAQRRHQKVMEEAPAPRISNHLRDALHSAALAAGQAVSYRNAGTVEFIVGADESFFFMEMNTRLQVEHPVTEYITGLDLVEWQLRVASGKKLPLKQEQITARGSAIEARIYAERPEQNFLPASGTITTFQWPIGQIGVRMDRGYDAGDTVTPWYDPLLAKLCVHADNRDSAIDRLQNVLQHTALFGPGNNLAFLRRIAVSPAFEQAQIDTLYLDRNLAELVQPLDVPVAVLLVAAVRASANQNPRNGTSPWQAGDAWRIQIDAGARLVLRDNGREWRFQVRGNNGHYRIEHEQNWHNVAVHFSDHHEGELCVDGGEPMPVCCIQDSGHVQVIYDQRCYEFAIADPYTWEAGKTIEDIHPTAPMPGKIVSIAIQVGDRVEKNQLLVSMEGMKMEFALRAATAGTVKSIHIKEGDFVEADAVLVDLE